MNKKLISKLIMLYDDIYTERPYRLKMVCFIVYKGKILSWGVNSDKTSTAQHYWRTKTKGTENYIYDKRHAEVDAINKLPHDFKDFKKAELLIVSKKKDGNFRLAKLNRVIIIFIYYIFIFGFKNIHLIRSNFITHF